MAHNTRLPTDHNVVANFGTAAYAGLGRDYGIIAYLYIMGYLYQVIEFGARFNERRTDGGAVDGGVSTNLHKIFHDYIANLRYFFKAAICLRRKTKSITAYNRTG